MTPRTIDHDHDETGRIGCPRCRLNEAAPELLAACQAAILYRNQTHHGDDPCLVMLRHVIARATGEEA